MIQRVLRYSRPNAELRGMISRLLTPEQLRALAASPDQESVLRSLQDSPYQDRVSPLLEGPIALPAAERALAESLLEVYRRTAAILGGEQGAFVLEMARRLELDNLKAILRGKVRGEPAAALRPLLLSLGSISHLPTEELLAAEDVEAAASVLDDTDYGRVLRNALPRFSTEGSLFSVEIALDLDYYRRLWLSLERLPAHDKDMAERMMGVRYDLLNVDWIVRYRLVHNLSPEEIYNYTLPYGRRLSGDTIRRAASATTIDGITATLPEPYRSLLSDLANVRDPVEQAGLELQRYLVRVARSALVGNPFHFGLALALLWLKEAEVHDLRAILEGKRYHRTAESIVGRLWGIS